MLPLELVSYRLILHVGYRERLESKRCKLVEFLKLITEKTNIEYYESFKTIITKKARDHFFMYRCIDAKVTTQCIYSNIYFMDMVFDQ